MFGETHLSHKKKPSVAQSNEKQQQLVCLDRGKPQTHISLFLRAGHDVRI